MEKKSLGRIPCLDGLRAISIALVLVMHLSGTRNFVPTSAVDFFTPGFLGVRVFFVISGFLITTLLLRELELTRTISLKKFYMRRMLRIFPVFYAYIIVLALLGAAGMIVLDRHDLLYAATYIMDYHTDTSWYVTHLWSLSVEEQFYFLWPAALFLAGRRRGMKIALAVALLVPVIRLGYWYLLPVYRESIYRRFDTTCDALAMGCLLAGMRDWLGAQTWYRRILNSGFIYAVPFLIFFGCVAVDRPRIYYFVGLPLDNLMIAFLIDWLVRNPSCLGGRILNSRPFVHIGVLSYSIYLWQELFCGQWRFPNTWWGSFPVNLILALITAHASFYLIEKPFLSLKGKWETRAVVADAIPAPLTNR